MESNTYLIYFRWMYKFVLRGCIYMVKISKIWLQNFV